MNISNLAHSLLAFVFQCLVTVLLVTVGMDLLSSVFCGGAFSVGFYFGREVAQAERKLGTPPWWSGFQIHKWSTDSKYDFIFPTVSSILISVAIVLILT